MKKLFMSFALLLLILPVDFRSEDKSNSSYAGFQEIKLDRGKIIRDLTNEEKDEMFRKVERKFFGWSAYYYCQNVRVTFVQKVIEVRKNDSDIEVKQKIEYSIEEEDTTFFDVQGKMSYKVEGKLDKVIKFSGLIDNELKIGYKKTSSTKTKTKYEENITIKPKTRMIAKIEGTGIITNGVAKSYLFGFEHKTGLFEIFTITSMNKKIYTGDSPK